MLRCECFSFQNVSVRRAGVLVLVAMLAVASAVGWSFAADEKQPATEGTKNVQEKKPQNPFPGERPMAPPLEGGLGWLNSAGPIDISKLKGKVVLLDFWTYCCINCMHILPDLARLEEEFPNELVVIGVHSAKFDGEKDTDNIREAILRYDIRHPVVNDAKMVIWRNYGVRAWPTRVLIDPEGKYVGRLSGEGNYEAFETAIKKMIEYHEANGTLDRTPIHFQLEQYGTENTPLRFPGKVVADPKTDRIYIADSSHHRVVVAKLSDGTLLDVIGDGKMGLVNGDFASARFNDPQGIAFNGDTLYVADRKNHVIREIDLAAKTVATLAGTGVQGFERSIQGKAAEIPLASPWDLWLDSNDLYVAMAGTHQIWRMSLADGTIGNFAGSGREDIIDGGLADSAFAQPSGLAFDGKRLYVADSEVSAIREIDVKDGEVRTVVGEGLFEFGDVDGEGSKVRLQHALGVGYLDGKLYVADTYNNKIKTLDPKSKASKTFLGDGKPGAGKDPVRFDEPGGLSVAAGKLYVADTNNHQIRVIDPATGSIETLDIKGLTPPVPEETDEVTADIPATTIAEVALASTGSLKLSGKVDVPAGSKLNPKAPMSYRLSKVGEDGKAVVLSKGRIESGKADFVIEAKDADLSTGKHLDLEVTFYPCEEGSEGVCRIKTDRWQIPYRVAPDGSAEVSLSAK